MNTELPPASPGSDRPALSGDYRRVIMNMIPDGLITIDNHGIIRAANAAVTRIFGYEEAELLGENIKILMPEPYHSGHDGYLDHYEKTGEKKIIGQSQLMSARRRNGTVFPMELSVDEVLIDDTRIFVGIIRDMTQRSAAEAEAGLLAAIIESSEDAIISKTLDGHITSWNAGATRLFGYAASEAIGQHINLIIPLDRRAEEQEIISQIRAGHPVEHMETIRLNKSGHGIDIALSVSPVRNNAGCIVGASKIVRDITERRDAERKLKEEADRMTAVLNTVLDGLITIDEGGIVQSFNPSAVRIFGYQPGEVIGHNVSLLMSDPYRGHHDGYLRNYLAAGIKKAIYISGEVTARRKDGSIFPVELGVNETTVDGRRLFVGTIRDISERKAAEREIFDHLAALKRSNQELDDFAHIASHDLKEPLRGLSTNALFLSEDYHEQLGAAGIKRLQRMTYLCERMERLVNDLLYFARLGRQNLAVQPADLNDAIAEISAMMEAGGSQGDFTIRIPSRLPLVTCDLPRIKEVFRNLIENAVKYNDKAKKWVEIGCAESAGEQVFYVRDNGIGIASNFFSDVFRIFKRLNEESDATKGTGVGLTFVKKIIERHHGRIWIESTIGQGSTFYFTLADSKGAAS